MPTLQELAAQGVRGMTTGLLGGPVDLMNLLLLGAGGEKPVMGGEWIGDKLEGLGLLAPRGTDTGSTLAELAGGLLAPGAPLKLAAGAKTLPMLAMALVGAKKGKRDEAAIQKLMAEQGYLPGPGDAPKWWHGHGGDKDYDVIDPERLGSATKNSLSSSKAFFLNSSHRNAEVYAENASGKEGGGSVMELVHAFKSPVRLTWPKDAPPYYSPRGDEILSDLLDDVKAAGHDAVFIRNAHRAEAGGGETADIIAVLKDHLGTLRDPRRAGFDAEKKGQNSLLAQLAALGIGAGSLYGISQGDEPLATPYARP